MSDEPKTITITPEQADLLGKAEAMLQDSKVRGNFLGLMRDRFPEVPIPEVDISRGFQATIEAQEKRLQEMEAKEREREVQARVAQGRASALKVSGIAENDLPEIEKMMTEKGIADHVTAATYLSQSRQLAGGSVPAGEGKKKSTEPNPFVEAREKFGGDIREWSKAEALKIGVPRMFA